MQKLIEFENKEVAKESIDGNSSNEDTVVSDFDFDFEDVLPKVVQIFSNEPK
jgi:hypothetical protein